jgi:hypothetical protein
VPAAPAVLAVPVVDLTSHIDVNSTRALAARRTRLPHMPQLKISD